MWPDLIIKDQVVCPALPSVMDGLIGMEIHLFVFEAPLQPFDEDVVSPSPGPIHTNLNPVVFPGSR